MSSFNLSEVTKALEGTNYVTKKESGVSFEGKNLKLNNADDAKPLVEAIIACKELGYLNLAGNTLGVDAAEALAKALEKHPEFKRALWKDLFTGRLKEEIPKALEHLGNGLVKADARLTELDLSDNAFGPIGVQGLASLLRSQACYGLRVLRLNNNGLGITGGRLLASALTDCHRRSKEHGTPLALHIFVAGRNRLENDGAKALAEVFQTIGTFEEISMPQNGIYHVGVTALSEAFAKNKNLQVLNLNDNTLGSKGSKALAKALCSLQKLRSINLGDCLLKTRGAEYIAEAISSSHPLIEELNFESNDIRARGGVALANAVAYKPNLQHIQLDANQFGSEAREEIRSILTDAGHADALPEFEEDESDASDDDEDEDDEEDVEEEEDEDDEDEDEDSEDETTKDDVDEEVQVVEEPAENKAEEVKLSKISVVDFINSPTAENFLGLGNSRTTILLTEAKSNPDEMFLDKYVPILMKVSALTASSQPEVAREALNTSEVLYKELFAWGQRSQQHSLLNNSLLVHLGLIKSEDKKFKPIWNIEGCLLAIESVLKQQFFPVATRDTLKVFMGRQVPKIERVVS